MTSLHLFLLILLMRVAHFLDILPQLFHMAPLLIKSFVKSVFIHSSSFE